MNLCWIIPIIVGLITAVLGYFFGRWSRQRDVDEWQDKYTTEKENLIAIQRKIPLLERDLAKAQESEVKANAAYKELKGRFDLLQTEWDKNRTLIQNLKDENKVLAQQLAECRQRSGEISDDS